MTGQDLIDFIQANDLQDWSIESKIHGEVFLIVDAARVEGMIRLYPQESDE